MDSLPQLLQRGIAAARAGQHAEARRLLRRVTELDESNVQAWLWLSEVALTMQDRRACLEHILAFEPDNAVALAGMRWLDAHPPNAIEVVCPGCGTPLALSDESCPKCGLQFSKPETQPLHEVRQEPKRLQPALPYASQQGWGEVTRRVCGFFLPLGLSAWVNAKLSLFNIRFVVWVALLLGGIGAYFWTSAVELPRNPGMVALCGESGLTHPVEKWAIWFFGVTLWLGAFGFILAKV